MKFLVTIAFLLQCCLVFSQTPKLQPKVRAEFCQVALLNYQYGSDFFKYAMITCARKLGINNIPDIEIAIENISKNVKLQEEFFKYTVTYIGGSNDYVFMQFHSLGMSAENAKTLAKYSIDKYKKVNTDNLIIDK